MKNNFFHKIKNSVKNRSMLTKNFFRLLAFVFVVIFGFSVYTFSVTKSKINGEYLQTAKNDVQKISVVTDTGLSELFSVAPQLAAGDNYKIIMTSDNAQELFYDKIGIAIKEKIDAYPILYSYVHSIDIYFEQSDWFYSTFGYSSDVRPSWLNDYKTMGKEKSKIVFGKASSGYPYLITYIYKLNYAGCDSAVAVTLNVRDLSSVINRGIVSNQQAYIISDNKIIYEKNISEYMADVSEREILKQIAEENENPLIFKFSDKYYSFASFKSGQFDWDYWCITELKDYNDKMSLQKYMFQLILIFAIISSVLVTFFFSLSIYKPVRALVNFVDNTEETPELSNLDGEEVKYIAEKIRNMLEQSGKLKNELDTQIKALKETEITALKMQINPHFLFNTLNLINLHLSDKYGFDYSGNNMISSLSAVLRYTFATETNTVPVEKEIKNLGSYTEILKERYSGRFEISYEIPPEINGCKIPVMTFQPIIENSVYHGFKKSTENKIVSVKISGFIKDETLYFVISDNGCGIEEGKLKELNESLKSPSELKSAHIGLYNVNRRIKLIYGENYGINITSKEGKGTVIILTFPKQ